MPALCYRVPVIQLATAAGALAALGALGLPADLLQRTAASARAGVGYGTPAPADACGDLLVALACVATLYAALHAALPVPRARGPGGALAVSYDLGSSVLVSACLFAAYADGCVQLSGSVADRWTGRTALTHAACVLHVAENVLAALLYPALGKPAEMYAHHALVIVSYGCAVLTGKGHLWCAAAGLTEGTNLFLFPITSGDALGWAPLAKGGPLHTASGALLWASFTAIRLGALPYTMYAYAADALAAPDAWAAMPAALKWLQWPSALAILVLSAMWYVKITRGVLKALGLAPREAPTARKAE
jgi:hypothetical protein